MKAYRFRLARLLDLRRRKLEAAEAALAQALSEAAAADRRAARFAEEAHETIRKAAEKDAWTAGEMAAAHAWGEALQRQRQKALEGAKACRARIEGLRRDVQAARVGVRVLESLDERRRTEWRREADREEETVASELFLARWMRRKP